MGSLLARGGSVLAASLLVLLGVYHFFSGIAGFSRSNFYTVGSGYPYHLNSFGWGWIHVIGGVLLVITGLSLFSPSATWARPVAIGLCILSVIANFFFVVFFPLWALLMIGLGVFAIWALARDGQVAAQRAETAMGSRYGAQQHAQGQQQGGYTPAGTYGTGGGYQAGQSGQRWPENVGRDESQGRQWAPADVKEGAGRSDQQAQQQHQQQVSAGSRGAGQAGRNAAEEAAQRAQQGQQQAQQGQQQGRDYRSSR